MGLQNYISLEENPEAALGEINRLVDRGFAVIIPKEEAMETFKRGTVSRLALISKMKETGMKHHRIIIDLRRSGGNHRCTVNERIILPRVVDVIRGVQDLWRHRGSEGDDPEFHLEMVGFDLSDAYCHFGIAQGELAHSLAPHPDGKNVILFKAMLFGFKAAPLVMGRLSATMTRLWQSCLAAHQGMVQTYMDDPLVTLQGTKKERDTIISMLL